MSPKSPLPTMIACLDVNYSDRRAIAAGLVFRDWLDESVVAEHVVPVDNIQPYKAGEFYLRELPCLLAVLHVLPSVEIVLIDGYVWLEESRPGLGAHLYRSLAESTAVIGVAKSRYPGTQNVQEITRGKSRQPLYISAAGMSAGQAAKHVSSMSGPYRIPALLKRVDVLSRSI